MYQKRPYGLLLLLLTVVLLLGKQPAHAFDCVDEDTDREGGECKTSACAVPCDGFNNPPGLQGKWQKMQPRTLIFESKKILPADKGHQLNSGRFYKPTLGTVEFVVTGLPFERATELVTADSPLKPLFRKPEQEVSA